MVSLGFLNEKLTISKSFRWFLLFAAVRLASVWLIQTWYVPDEYWQSLEVSHNMVFNYGFTTWEWVLGIRSYVHPLFIALLYKILQVLGIDTTSMLVLAPRVGQAMLSAYSDLKFYQWSGNHKWAAFNIATSWFWFYTGSRTIINSFETSLTVIALSQFPWNKKEDKGSGFIWLVGMLCASRPTAAIPWLPLCLHHVITTDRSELKATVFRYLSIGFVILCFSVGLDSLCYGRFVVTSWQFLKLNVLKDVGSWYGRQPWHWYFSMGLPTVLGIHTLPFAISAVKTIKHRHILTTNVLLLTSIVFTLLVYSCLPHKEFRFILPLVPMALYLSSDLIARWSHKANNVHLWLIALIVFVSNAVPASYLGLVHQRGTLDVMGPIGDMAQSRPTDTSVLFLMPCHSTPYYSHVHVNVSLRFLSCEPNLDNAEGYKDEADSFYENPNKWLHMQYPSNGTLPSHIVTFDTLIPSLSSILGRYKPIHRFYHTALPLSSRIGHHVVIHQHLQY